MLFLFLFVLGACLGSFLWVVIDRLPQNKSIIRGRSMCDSCKKTLSWFELIPVFSYIFQKGICRHCSKKISPKLLFGEFLSGFVPVLLYLFAINNSLGIPFFIYSLLLAYSLIAIFVIDLEHGIIPDQILIFLGVVSLGFLLIFDRISTLEHLLAGFAAFLFFLLLFLATKGKGIGFGDVKFAFVIGLVTGFPGVIEALYVAFLTGAFVGLILIISKKKKLHGSTVPFGPFLVIGMIVAFFSNSFIWNLFLNLSG